jgi:hypothetical protein
VIGSTKPATMTSSPPHKTSAKPPPAVRRHPSRECRRLIPSHPPRIPTRTCASSVRHVARETRLCTSITRRFASQTRRCALCLSAIRVTYAAHSR